jgi:glycosyltransferase involved in cell wall biosynthesis
VVFAQDTVNVGLFAAVAARAAGVPLVIRVPGDYAWEQGTQRLGIQQSFDDFQQRSYGLHPVTLLRLLQVGALRSAQLVVAPSEYFRRTVIGWGVPEARVRAIYNGIAPVSVEAPPTKQRQIISVGRLVPWKGFRTLIELMPRLPGWRLVIVGDGPDRESLEALANREGTAGRVQLLGALPRDEMLREVAVSSVFVLNTRFESFSFQTVEAMQLGVPVVLARTGSLPELVEDKKEGLFVEPDDEEAIIAAVKRLDEDDVLRSRLVEAARTRAEYFSIDTTVDRLATELERLPRRK